MWFQICSWKTSKTAAVKLREFVGAIVEIARGIRSVGFAANFG